MIACDLGSNTLRIVRFDCKTHQRLDVFERIVRTAKDLHVSAQISQEAQNTLFAALHEASARFDFRNEPCFAVATEAMRVASNAHDILARIETSFGIRFTVISGEEEARLTSLAVEYALKREQFDASRYVLFDLGGGSTEITFCNNQIKESRSFPFGIVTTAERYSSNIETHIAHLVEQTTSFIERFTPIQETFLQLVTTAGTPTTVAAFLEGLDYEHYHPDAVNGKILHVSDFDRAFTQLTQMEPSEAERYTGTNRRDLVIVGILMVKAIMRKLGFEKTIVIDDGLREGVAIANCNTLVLS
jgi:exopolyphosphatase/guanosine-5'-triphosphate,3'-diphosphate pyrophosphatase